jgi:hypothetical protein
MINDAGKYRVKDEEKIVRVRVIWVLRDKWSAGIVRVREQAVRQSSLNNLDPRQAAGVKRVHRAEFDNCIVDRNCGRHILLNCRRCPVHDNPTQLECHRRCFGDPRCGSQAGVRSRLQNLSLARFMDTTFGLVLSASDDSARCVPALLAVAKHKVATLVGPVRPPDDRA